MTLVAKTFSPVRVFFRVSEDVKTLKHAQEVFRKLGQFGDMVEYKFVRCPEIQRYLKIGFVVYKNQDDAQNALSEHFIKIDSPLFNQSSEIKVEKSDHQQHKEHKAV